MPGLIVMDQQSNVGSLDLKKDRSYAQIPPLAQTNGQTHHDANGLLPNGVDSSGHAPTNGEEGAMDVASHGPPQLDQSWQQGPSNKSLGKMVERLTQKCFQDLTKTVEEMSKVPFEAEQPQANGIVPHTGQDTSEGSLTRKKLLMDFANEQRFKFTQALILTDFAKNNAEQTRLIDVKVWQDSQLRAGNDAIAAFGRMKQAMAGARMPNPNIEGAMEVLSTGKASWIPDMGYIPPKKLTAKQILTMLREMNVILATRLVLNEDVPSQFEDYSIADGRATFKVQDEFEVDLSIADEDPATPFYFIDIRLSFTPTSDILDERARNFMETKINHELATKGLKGCYDFLHNFVLTHKINVLRSQATDLIRGRWFDCIKLEYLRRTLVVQYWATLPGPKSWFEIGVSSGKSIAAGTGKPPNPHISMRWFRKAVLVNDDPLEFDWRNLGLEKCILIATSKHIASVMNDTASRLRTKISATPASVLTLQLEDQHPNFGHLLTLNLPSLREPLKVHIEPVTGQFCIRPPTRATAHVQQRLNTDPNAEAATRLAGLASAVVQEDLGSLAAFCDWIPTPNLASQDTLRTVFGEAFQQLSVYTPSELWSDKWALAVTFGLSGEKWWTVKVDQTLEADGVLTRKLAHAHPVPVPDDIGRDLTTTHWFLLQMEKTAVEELRSNGMCKHCKGTGILYKSERLVQSITSQAPAPVHSSTKANLIDFLELMKPVQGPESKPWSNGMIRVTHHGFSQRHGFSQKHGCGIVRHDIRLTVANGRLQTLREHLKHHRDRDLTLSDSGGLAISIFTPFGEPWLQQVQESLQSVEHLNDYLDTLKERHCKCTHASLSKLAFTYSESPLLGAEVTLDGAGLPVGLTLSPPESNPHQRSRVVIEKELQHSNGYPPVAALTFILSFTLPVLQAFDRLEAIDPARQILNVHVRAATEFKVKYRAQFLGYWINIKARQITQGARKGVNWAIDFPAEPPSNQPARFPEELTKAMGELRSSSGEQWQGMGATKMIVADSKGVGTVLEKIDEIVRRFEGANVTTAPASVAETKTLTEGAASAVPQPRTNAPPPAPATSISSATIKREPDVIMLD